MLHAVLLLSFLLSAPARADELPPEVACVRVVDGDTIVCEGDDGKRFVVRLIGVDTPETVHPTRPDEPYGPEASAFTRSAAEGKMVRLVGDPVAGAADFFRRKLAYVFIGDSCLNEELVRAGCGRAYLRYKFDPVMRVKVQLLERAAREGRRGLWAAEPR